MSLLLGLLYLAGSYVEFAILLLILRPTDSICIQPPRADIVPAELPLIPPQLIICTRFTIRFSSLLADDDVNESTSEFAWTCV